MRTLFFTTISKEATQLALLLSIASAFSLAGCNYSVLKKAGTQASANNQAGLPGQPKDRDASLALTRLRRHGQDRVPRMLVRKFRDTTLPTRTRASTRQHT